MQGAALSGRRHRRASRSSHAVPLSAAWHGENLLTIRECRAIYTVDKWRSQMDHVRRVAVKLARQGRIAIEQHKARLDHDAWDAGGRKGIIRLRYLGS